MKKILLGMIRFYQKHISRDAAYAAIFVALRQALACRALLFRESKHCFWIGRIP